MIIRFAILIFFIITATAALSQNTYYKGFQSPVDFRITLSGTFGELRSDHFHSGIDIKTYGATGKYIYAIGDGYVSRIKVSPSGFGKTLYINHPEGYTSVYAHLSDFREDIKRFVRDEQYRRERFALNIFPEKDQFLVRKGEIIALSGNSGYSFGPHLHFEIREASSQVPVNPLLFGIDIPDDISPRIRAIRIYPVGPGSRVNGKAEAQTFLVNGRGKGHYIVNKDTIRIHGDVAFGIDTYDQLNGAGNRNGVYEILLYTGNKLFFKYRLQRFAFHDTRYINSLIDYPEYKRNKQRFIRTLVEPNNRLKAYEKLENEGIFNSPESTFHNFRYVVTDLKGNHSELNFTLWFEDKSLAEPTAERMISGQVKLSWRDNNTFERDGVRLFVPAYALYDNVLMEYSVSDAFEGAYSKVYHIHNGYTPVHKYINLSIKPEGLPAKLQSKALLARVDGDENNGKLEAAGGKYENDHVTSRIREFGKYLVVIDTVPPEIMALNFRDRSVFNRYKILKLKIMDDFSGIDTYRGTMNGKWILMEYDAKNDLLLYRIDEIMVKGENHFKLVVTDQKDNESIREYTLFLD